jgi:hypothetical protein
MSGISTDPEASIPLVGLLAFPSRQSWRVPKAIACVGCSSGAVASRGCQGALTQNFSEMVLVYHAPIRSKLVSCNTAPRSLLSQELACLSDLSHQMQQAHAQQETLVLGSGSCIKKSVVQPSPCAQPCFFVFVLVLVD